MPTIFRSSAATHGPTEEHSERAKPLKAGSFSRAGNAAASLDVIEHGAAAIAHQLDRAAEAAATERDDGLDSVGGFQGDVAAGVASVGVLGGVGAVIAPRAQE
jgi:hypothetical protein